MDHGLNVGNEPPRLRARVVRHVPAQRTAKRRGARPADAGHDDQARGAADGDARDLQARVVAQQAGDPAEELGAVDVDHDGIGAVAQSLEAREHAPQRRVRVARQQRLVVPDPFEEGESGLAARHGEEVADALHDGAVDVGGVEGRGRDRGGEAVGDEGEGAAAGFEIVEEGVRVAGAADVDDGHGGFEDRRGVDAREAALEVYQAGGVELVVETVGGFLNGTPGDVGRWVKRGLVFV